MRSKLATRIAPKGIARSGHPCERMEERGVEAMQKPISFQINMEVQQPISTVRQKRRSPFRVWLARLAVHVAELHPYTWALAWLCVRHFSFLLPHDKSYYALRHFIALKPNGLFLDVGANDGISALSFRCFDKNYQILSLEPNGLLERSLKRIKVRDPRFDYIMVGAGSQPSLLRFYVPSYKGIVLHTSTSSSPDHVLSALAASFGKSVVAAATIKTIEGRIIRIDDLAIEPTIIKIDAEGFNYDVLLGAAETIRRLRPFLIIEIESEEVEKIKSYFEDMRYRLVGYDVMLDRFCAGAGTPYSDLYRNFFAVPEEMLPSLPWADSVTGAPEPFCASHLSQRR
jgi:FkbM family methyltransferase